MLTCMTTEIWLCRHGETEWSRDGRHTSITDLELTAEGEEVAATLAERLAGTPFDLVITSPRLRARRTAELAGLFDGNVETALEPDLVEVDYGGYEGLTTPEIIAGLGHPWSLWADGTVPGETPGENLAQVATRVDRVLDRVRPLLADGDVALVAHGHVLRILTARWLRLGPEAGALFPLAPGRYGVLGHERERPALTGWNTGCP
jgi:broad specificity phosphatase PhoE